MSIRLEDKWDSLQPDTVRPVFQLYDARHLLPFYIGRESDGRRSLLLLCNHPLPALDGFRFIDIRTHKRDDETLALVLSLQNHELQSVFSLLCEDLIESSRHISDQRQAARFVILRLEKWRRLLEQEVPPQLGEAKVRGLFGELFFLEILIGEIGETSAVEGWVGPIGADQDFQRPERAWEIKSIRPDAQYVNISSERQLLSSGKDLQLVTITITERSSEGDQALSLNSMVSRLRERLLHHHAASDILEERLLNAGYTHRDAYDFPILSVIKFEKFKINESFPRIVSSALCEGIFDVNYKLALAICRKHIAD